MAKFYHLIIILFEFFGIPSSRNCAFVEVFEAISSCSGFHPDSVGSHPVGGEFSLLRVFLFSPENEVAYFEFPLYDFFAVASGYFLF